MNFNKILFLALFATIVLSGCIKMDMSLTVNSDGTGTSVLQMDYSKLEQLMAGLPTDETGEDTDSPTSEDYSKANICATLKAQEGESDESDTSQVTDSVLFSNGTCEGVDDWVVKYTKSNFDLVEAGVLTVEEVDGKKIYTVKIQEKQDTPASPDTPTDATQLKALGLEMNMTVVMPGTVTNTTAGDIGTDQKTVEIDLLDYFGELTGEGITITSEESLVAETAGFDFGSDTMLYVGGIVVVLVVLIAAFFFLKK